MGPEVYDLIINYMKIMRLYLLIGLIAGLAGLPVSAAQAVAQDTQGLNKQTAVYNALSMGTGWSVTSQHVVTNYHVVANSHNLRLVTPEQKEIPVKVLLSDAENDLAILQILGPTRLSHPLPLASQLARLGSSVFTVGYPHPNLLGTSPKLTTGHINAVAGLADDPRTYQVSVPVQSGNSGGPLLNRRGEVVGIITSKLNARKMFEWTGDIPQNINYAIKVQYLQRLIKQLEHPSTFVPHTAKHDLDFETLATNVLPSIVIVAGDTASEIPAVATPETTPFASAKQSGERIVLYAYNEPGPYDVELAMPGSRTIDRYSRSMINLMELNLRKQRGEQTMFTVKSGEVLKNFYRKLLLPRYTSTICRNENASKIIMSFSPESPGNHFRHVAYRIIDCDSLREYSKEYRIERDERYDTFGYEMDLHASFNRFLFQIPPFVNWAKR